MPITPPTAAGDELSLRDLVMWQDPERMSGAPCFTNTRVPVKNLFDYIEGGDTIGEFMEDFPGVTREQILGALRIGKERLLAPVRREDTP